MAFIEIFYRYRVSGEGRKDVCGAVDPGDQQNCKRGVVPDQPGREIQTLEKFLIRGLKITGENVGYKFQAFQSRGWMFRIILKSPERSPPVPWGKVAPLEGVREVIQMEDFCNFA
jgi:hypothetical protein